MTDTLAHPTLSPDLALAIRLAREAGAAIEAVRAVGFSAHVKVKADTSPVTEADLAADRLIRAGLLAARPDDALLSEESLAAAPRPDQALWCVDPLDGTEAFVDGAHGDGLDYVRGYAVQIAKLVPDGEHYQLELGVTYEPRVDELFFAERGRGAFRALGGVEAGPLTMRTAGTPPTLITSKRVDRILWRRFLANGHLDGGALRSVGVKVGRLVLGEADLYLATHKLSWWDLAAPQLILEEAGGAVRDLAGERPRYRLGTSAHPVFEGPFVMGSALLLDDALALLRG